jgi:uncharacterized protein (TIGR00730 family)
MEITKNDCSEIICTATMHERKVKMLELADAAVVLPGGFGTLDEMFEALTLAQLQLFDAPVGMLNTDGYYDPLVAMLDKMVEKGFLQERNRQKLFTRSSVDELIETIVKNL